MNPKRATHQGNRIGPNAPSMPAQRSSALPSVGLGTLRTRWTRYSVSPLEQVPVNLNCWRASIYFFQLDGSKPKWDGINISDMVPGASVELYVKVVIGGAMFDQRPVYMNETHYLSGLDSSILVVEEFFDGATRPNN